MAFDGAFVEDGPLSWIAHDGGKPGRCEEEAITNWTECSDKQGSVGVLRLEADDPDATVDTRFDRAAANVNQGSKTVQESIEWHPLSHLLIAKPIIHST